MKNHYNIKVGTKFYHKHNTLLIYEIYKIDIDNAIYVKWYDIYTNKEHKLKWCYMSTFIDYLDDKDYILVIDKLTYKETL
jgi:hypothetical protein